MEVLNIRIFAEREIGAGSWGITPRRLSQLTPEYDCSICSRIPMRCKCVVYDQAIEPWASGNIISLAQKLAQIIGCFISGLHIWQFMKSCLLTRTGCSRSFLSAFVEAVSWGETKYYSSSILVRLFSEHSSVERFTTMWRQVAFRVAEWYSPSICLPVGERPVQWVANSGG